MSDVQSNNILVDVSNDDELREKLRQKMQAEHEAAIESKDAMRRMAEYSRINLSQQSRYYQSTKLWSAITAAALVSIALSIGIYILVGTSGL